MLVNEKNRNIYDEIGTPSKKNYKAICKFTEPLKTYLGIDRFWRNFHGADGTYSLIGNYPPTAEIFFGLNLFNGHPYFRDPIFFRSGYTIPGLLQSQDFEKTQGRLIREGDCHHVFIKIQKLDSGFIEYGFASSKHHLGFEMSYLNHLSAINKFVDYFEESACKIIRESNEYSIDIFRLIGNVYKQNPNIPGNIMVPENELCFLTRVEKDSERATALFSLSKSEKTCLKLYILGNTTKEIGQKLYRSPRTVETHLEVAKQKLGLKNRSALTEFLMPFIDVL